MIAEGRRSNVRETLPAPVDRAEKSQPPQTFHLAQDAMRLFLTSLPGDVLDAQSEALRHKSKDNNQAPAGLQRKLTQRIFDGVIESGVDTVEMSFLELPLVDPFIAVVKGAMSKLAAESVEPYWHRLKIGIQGGRQTHLNDTIKDIAQRFVADKAGVDEVWGKYMLGNPENVHQEKQKLEHWENRVEAARLNRATREREWAVEGGKVKLGIGPSFDAHELGTVPRKKSSPQKQTGRRRKLNEPEGTQNPTKGKLNDPSASGRRGDWAEG